jgi:hypothetical protein
MYSTTGKKSGKAKHRTAAAAAKSRRNQESWQQLMEKYDVKTSSKVVVGKSKSTGKDHSKSVVRNTSNWRSRVDPRRLTDHIPSVDTGVGVAVKNESPQYTGDAMLGIGQLHKSNAIPVFKQEDAADLAKMRR